MKTIYIVVEYVSNDGETNIRAFSHWGLAEDYKSQLEKNKKFECLEYRVDELEMEE